MLMPLLRRYLRPYRRPLVAVVALQLVGTMASLYLPSLNADIIDNGVAAGDTAYIVRTGGWMLLVTLVQIVVLDRRGLLRRAGRDELRPRRARRRLPPRRRVLGARGGAASARRR